MLYCNTYKISHIAENVLYQELYLLEWNFIIAMNRFIELLSFWSVHGKNIITWNRICLNIYIRTYGVNWQKSQHHFEITSSVMNCRESKTNRRLGMPILSTRMNTLVSIMNHHHVSACSEHMSIIDDVSKLHINLPFDDVAMLPSIHSDAFVL